MTYAGPTRSQIEAHRKAWDQQFTRTKGEMRRLAKYRMKWDAKAFGDVGKSARKAGRQGKELQRLGKRAAGLKLGSLFRIGGAELAGPAAFALFAAAVLKAYGDQQGK